MTHTSRNGPPDLSSVPTDQLAERIRFGLDGHPAVAALAELTTRLERAERKAREIEVGAHGRVELTNKWKARAEAAEKERDELRESEAEWQRRGDRSIKAEARVTKLTTALDQVLLSSLLRIRQAAFGPEIGVRYTEAIRSEIANECRRLEDFIRAALAGSEDSCAHEWVDARNEVVESGEMCPKCGAFRAGSEDSPFGPPSCNEPRKRGGDVRAKPTSGGGPNPLASVPIWQLESQVCDALYRELDAEATEGAEEALCEIVRRAGSEDS